MDGFPYHESINEMYVLLDDMRAEGLGTEEIARAVSAKCNEIRLSSYDGDPDGLAAAKARNLERYGHEEGPLPDELFEQYGSWEEVIWKAFSANPGMDACLGLYDDYYPLYVASGMIDEEEDQQASREYAAVLAESFAMHVGAEAAFSDFDQVSDWYAASVQAAIAAGILRGYEDATLRPGRTITRAEACAILARCLSDGLIENKEADLPGVPGWASAEIQYLVSEGIVADTAGVIWDEPLSVAEFRALIRPFVDKST